MNISDSETYQNFIQDNIECLKECKDTGNYNGVDKNLIDYLIELNTQNIYTISSCIGYNTKRKHYRSAYLSFTVERKNYFIVCDLLEKLLEEGLLRDFYAERVLSNDYDDDRGICIDKITIFSTQKYSTVKDDYTHLKKITDRIIEKINNI
jgi:hypothetical protein